MPTVTEITREVAVFVTHEPSSVWVFSPTREVALLNDTPTVTPFAVEREVAVLNDTATGTGTALLLESALLNDVPTPAVSFVRILRDTALLTSRTVAGVRVTDSLREVATLNDAASSDLAVTLRETAELNDPVTPTVTARQNLRETALLLSRPVIPVAVTAHEVALLGDAASPQIVARQTARDTALLNDSQTAGAARRDVLRDVARLNDEVSTVVQGGSVLRDVAYIFDTPVPPLYGRAYTCSIAEWGMSTLSNYSFLTMAGNFAAGQNLWRLNATTDNGTAITSYIKTGVVDMGASQVKRLTAVYVAGTADAPLTISVTGDVNGQVATHAYQLELRDQTNYRNNRALIGKGFRGRFAQFKIAGTGVKYSLLAAEADTSVTARRV